MCLRLMKNFIRLRVVFFMVCVLVVGMCLVYVFFMVIVYVGLGMMIFRFVLICGESSVMVWCIFFVNVFRLLLLRLGIL